MVSHGDRYVAMGSSFAAGPGIGGRAAGSPSAARRSTENYPHLVAAALGLELCDVTYSGAHTEHILDESQNGEPPQLHALDGTERLVTLTIGGNNVGYVQGLLAASLPAFVRRLPLLRDRLDHAAIDARLRALEGAMRAVAARVRERAPRARVVFVDYLTVLPEDRSVRTWPIAPDVAQVCARMATRLAAVTAAAAVAEGCEVVRVSAASRDHHAWAARPWTTRLRFPFPGTPYHPNRDGMRAVAELLVGHLR